LKKYLTTPPTLVAHDPHKNLQLYILATSNVVSRPIVVEMGESDTNRKIQYPVYFISKVSSDSKTRYVHIMKLTYALLNMSHKLSLYFQAHQIEVHTSLTLGEILNNREALAFLSHRIICKLTNANCRLHPRVFWGIESTGKQ
jgi:hypothetical protein